MGYADSVLTDELNAYATTGLPSCLSASDMAPQEKAAVETLKKQLLGVFRRHFNFSIGSKKGLKTLASLAKSITL
jgi:hypothetical protein